MTERKPADMTMESWVDRQIRTAAERGDLDGLAGAGEPLPRSRGDDEMGWIRRKLAEEGLPTEALLPMSLQLRRSISALPSVLARIDPHRIGAEDEARAEISALNRRIAAWLRAPSPPMLPIAPVDAEHALARWRSTAAAAGVAAAGGAATAAGVAAEHGQDGSTRMDEPTGPKHAGAPAPGGRPTGHRPDPRVTVYWRPGCVFCQRLRLILRAKRLHPTMVDIHKHPEAAAFVRSVAQGNETVPTVVIDEEAHVNPAPRLVVEALRRR